MTPFSRLSCANVVLFCVGAAGASGAWAFDLNPFHLNSPAQQAQTAPPGVIPGVGPDAGDPNDPAEMVVRLTGSRTNSTSQRPHRTARKPAAPAAGSAAALPAGRRISSRRRGPARSRRSPRRFRARRRRSRRPEPNVPGAKPRRSDAFDPNADPNAPGAPRPLGSTPPSAPLTAGAPLDIGGRPAAATPAGPLTAPSGPVVADVAPANAPAGRPSAAPESILPTRPSSSSTPPSTPIAPVSTRRLKTQFKAFLAANGTHRWRPTRSSISAKPTSSVRDRAKRRSNTQTVD